MDCHRIYVNHQAIHCVKKMMVVRFFCKAKTAVVEMFSVRSE